MTLNKTTAATTTTIKTMTTLFLQQQQQKQQNEKHPHQQLQPQQQKNTTTAAATTASAAATATLTTKPRARTRTTRTTTTTAAAAIATTTTTNRQQTDNKQTTKCNHATAEQGFTGLLVNFMCFYWCLRVFRHQRIATTRKQVGFYQRRWGFAWCCSFLSWTWQLSCKFRITFRRCAWGTILPLFQVSRTLGTRQRCTFLMGRWWYVCGTVRVGWGGVGGLITFKYTSTHTRHATLLHVPLALAHTRHATLLHVSLALAHTRHATLLHVPLALAHIGHATAQNQLAWKKSCHMPWKTEMTTSLIPVCGNTYTSSSTDITRKTRNPSCPGWKTSFAYFCSSGWNDDTHKTL